MARPKPLDPPALASLKPVREPFLSAEIHVVTPMFGGGPVAGVPDAELPIHGTAVRGHLRFWWRACHGAQFASARELFGAEAAVWGQAASAQSGSMAPSAVDLTVEIVNPGKIVEPQPDARSGRLQLDRSFPQYVVFPFQGQAGVRGQPPEPPSNCLLDVIFRVRFTRAPHVAEDEEPQLKKAAEDALWGWVNFGGVGSRTRRGCGALFCADFAPEGDTERWLRQSAEQRLTHKPRALPIPVLSNARVVLGTTARPPLDAWRHSAQWLQDFRQGVNQGRNPGRQATRPGRSRWPEPDSIRETLSLHDPQHQPVHPARPYFPRADLGLPIIFQRMGSGGSDPSLEVSAGDASRFASPIIVKPLAVAQNRAVPIVVALNAPHLWEVALGSVKLRYGGREQAVPAERLYHAGKSTAVPPLQGQPTARDAFLQYVRTKPSCLEVTL